MPDGTIGYETPVLRKYIRKKEERQSEFEVKCPEKTLSMHPLSLSMSYEEVERIEAHLGFFNTRIIIEATNVDVDRPLRIPIDRERHEEAALILGSIFDENGLKNIFQTSLKCGTRQMKHKSFLLEFPLGSYSKGPGIYCSLSCENSVQMIDFVLE